MGKARKERQEPDAISNSPRSQILTDAEFQEVKARLDAGENPTEIARSLGRSVAAFHRLIKQRLEGYEPVAAWPQTVVLGYLAGLIDGGVTDGG